MKILISVFSALLLTTLVKVSLPSQIDSAAEINLFWLQKTFQSEDKNVIVAGDSRIYRGVSTEALITETALDLKGANLGYSSAGFSKEYLDFVVSKFDKDSAQKYLLLGVTPHSLTLEAFKNEHWHQFKDYSKAEVWKMKYLNPLLSAFSPVKPSEVWTANNNSYHQVYHKDGWIASNKESATPQDGYESYKKTFSKYKVSDVAVSSFLQSIAMLQGSGIKIVAFRPPSSTILRKLENQISGFDEAYMKTSLENLGVHWWHFEDDNYHAYDGSHLHYDSAKKFSQQLGERLSELKNK